MPSFVTKNIIVADDDSDNVVVGNDNNKEDSTTTLVAKSILNDGEQQYKHQNKKLKTNNNDDNDQKPSTTTSISHRPTPRFLSRRVSNINDDYDDDNKKDGLLLLSSDDALLLLPDWVFEVRKSGVYGEPLTQPEWETDNNNASSYRTLNGWCGNDYIHDVNAPVRIIDYYVQYNNNSNAVDDKNSSDSNNIMSTTTTIITNNFPTTLTGIVQFTNKAESHKGYCHGGSMCSIMDDIIGWCAFCVTGKCIPWSGYTVQVNTSLKNPIPVNSTLIIQGKITNVVRRKVYVTATLMSYNNDANAANTDDKTKNNKVIYATGEGIVVLNRGVLPSSSGREQKQEQKK